jgi:hypothetical protein
MVGGRRTGEVRAGGCHWLCQCSSTGCQYTGGASDIRRWRTALAVVLCLAGTAGACLPAVADASDGTSSSRAASDEATRAIPWQHLTRAHRANVQHVVRDASIYRRLPVRVIDCDPDMFTFLLRHPEVVVDTWRLMGISRVSLDRLAEGAYRGTDGAGTVGQIRVVYADWGPEAQNLAVIYAQGAYEGGPLTAPVKAESVVLLRSVSVREENGRHYVTVRVDSFIRIDRLGVELVAKTIQPWIARATDQNFIETLTFVSNFSRTAEKNPQGMQRLASRLPSVDEPTRHELVQLCFRTADRYADAQQSRHAGQTLLARHDSPIATGQGR